MKFTDIFVHRPVLALVVSLMILLAGLKAYMGLPVRQYPLLESSVITVSTDYPGAPAELMQGFITQPINQSLASVEGVDYVSSSSVQGHSVITLRMALNQDSAKALSEVIAKVNQVKYRLPEQAYDPVIERSAGDATAVAYVGFASTTLSAAAMTDYLSRVVQPLFATIEGVAKVQTFGGQHLAMRLWLDPQRMAGHGISADQVEQAIRANNFQAAPGQIKGQYVVSSIQVNSDLNTLEEFRDMVISNRGDHLLRLRDIAEIELGSAAYETSALMDAKPAVHLGLYATPKGNPLLIVAGIKRLLPDIQKTLPPGVEVALAFETAHFIEASILEVIETLLEAILIVVVIIFLCLGSWRTVLIPILSIPLSMLGALALMALFGFSINLLTLLAMVLAIGLVVDDAIVMLENIFRHIEEGLDPFSASIKGAREIGFAVITMTATLVAVYAPLAFTPGRTGRLFVEFALALAGAVVVSGFVALTLTPMMCSLLLKHNPKPNWFDRGMEKVLTGISDRYGRVIRWLVSTGYQPAPGEHGVGVRVKCVLLQARWLVIAMMGLSALTLYLVFPSMKQELSPLEDRGTILASVTAPDGATLDYTNRYARAIEAVGKPYAEFDRIFANVGNPTVSQASVVFRTVDWEDRSRSTLQLAREMGAKLSALPGVSAFPITPPSLGQGFRDRPVNFVIQTSDSYQNLNQVVRQMLDEIAKNPGIVSPDVDLRLNKPELRIDIDREKAADMGVAVDVVARAIETMLGGRNVTRYKRDAEQYDVIVQTQASGRTTPEDIDGIYVRGRNDTMIPLSTLVKVRESVSPRELNHFGQRRSVSITANLSPDYSLGEALNFLSATAAKVLKPGYTTDLNGTSREFRNSQGALAIVFVLALVFIFLVLAAQFESFIDPLVIMLSVPLSMVGALLALKWSGGSLNVYSQIGLITLVGLITKHGILIVEFTNQLREQGLELVDALVKASSQRLRPILMTTGAMVLGAVPLAFAHGAGAESRQQIGWVIVGGMSLGTLLTVFVVPVMYSLFARKTVPGANTAEAHDAAPLHGAHAGGQLDYIAK